MLIRPPQIAIAAALLVMSLNSARAEMSGDQSREVVYGSGPETHTQQVPFGDLNLMNEGGRAILMDRVSRAVDAVCGGRITDLIAQTEVRGFHHCQADSMADAMLKVQAVIADVQNSRSVAAAITVTPAGG
jgi:UrcA family protein